MMKQKFGNGGLRSIKFFGGVFLTFMVLWLFLTTGSFRFEDSLKSVVPDYEFNGQKAFAGEQDFEEAFVDSYLYDDTLIVIDTTAAPGDDFWLTVSLTNNTIEVATFDLLLEYDTSIIYPDYIITDPCYPDTPCTVFSIEAYKTARTEPLSWYIWAPARAFNNHIDSLRFSAATNLFEDPTPHLPAGGSGPVVRFKFWVKPDAEPGAKDTIRFIMFDPVTLNPANTLGDTIGLDTFLPRTRDGIFTVSGEEPGNHYPVFTHPTESYFEVNEGTTLEFDVTATDEDGDTIYLSMDPLDLSGLTYHFRDTSGVGSVTQRFDYTPGFDEAGTRYVKFIARDEHGYVTNKTVTIEVIEMAQDMLIASSQQGGVPGSKERLTPFMITNSVDIYGFQFTFRWDPNRVDVDSIVRTDVIEGFSMYTNLGDSAGKATVLVFGLAGEKIPAGVDTVVYPAFSVLPDAEPGEVDILLENAREAINPGYPSLPLGMVNGKFIIDMFGDANLDRMVDVGDVVSLVAYILGEIFFTSRQELAADVNQDTLINVGDMVAMIDIILGRWMGPSPPMYPGPMAIVRLDYEDLQPGSSGEVKVMADLEVPVAGAQLQIDYDPDLVSFQAPRLSERSDHFLMEYRDNENGRLTVLLYNMSNDPIPAGEGNILSLPVMLSPDAEDEFRIELKEVVLADQKAVVIPVGDGLPSVPIAFELSQNYPNPFNPSTTIKFTLPSPEDGGSTLSTTLKIYNVLGKVVRTLIDEPIAPGVHHKIWDGRDEEGNQVASGIYFYRLRAGALQDTKKMVLLK